MVRMTRARSRQLSEQPSEVDGDGGQVHPTSGSDTEFDQLDVRSQKPRRSRRKSTARAQPAIMRLQVDEELTTEAEQVGDEADGTTNPDDAVANTEDQLNKEIDGDGAGESMAASGAAHSDDQSNGTESYDAGPGLGMRLAQGTRNVTVQLVMTPVMILKTILEFIGLSFYAITTSILDVEHQVVDIINSMLKIVKLFVSPALVAPVLVGVVLFAYLSPTQFESSTTSLWEDGLLANGVNLTTDGSQQALRSVTSRLYQLDSAIKEMELRANSVKTELGGQLEGVVAVVDQGATRISELEEQLVAVHAEMKTKLASIDAADVDLEQKIEAVRSLGDSAAESVESVRQQQQQLAQKEFVNAQVNELDSQLKQELENQKKEIEGLVKELEKIQDAGDAAVNQAEMMEQLVALKVKAAEESSLEHVDSIRETLDLISKRLDTEIGKALADYQDKHETMRTSMDELAARETLGRDDVARIVNEAVGAQRGGSFGREDVLRIVQDALDTYDADKIGKADYALLNGGASVVASRTSKSYAGGAKYSLLGISLKSYAAPPETALSADNSLGNCWAFGGSEGVLTVKLAEPIAPQSFTIDHVPRAVARNINSAPKSFRVWGLQSNDDTEPVLLLEGVYTATRTVQQFPVTHKEPVVTRLIRLEILSNHGNDQYTCLYRFRAHGRRNEDL